MTPARYLVVNADDLGLSRGVNAGIAAAHEQGIVTSASRMVWQPAAEEAAAWARSRPGLSVGIHVDLGEWRAERGGWSTVYLRAALHDPDLIAAEVDAQLSRFSELTGAPPTHLDSHQHVHRRPAVRSVLVERAAALGVPLRECSHVTYIGGFYGQDGRGESLPDLLAPTSLLGLLASLPAGWSELGCHPGFAEDVDSIYRSERRLEVQALCDPTVRRWLDDHEITLASFREAA